VCRRKNAGPAGRRFAHRAAERQPAAFPSGAVHFFCEDDSLPLRPDALDELPVDPELPDVPELPSPDVLLPCVPADPELPLVLSPPEELPLDPLLLPSPLADPLDAVPLPP